MSQATQSVSILGVAVRDIARLNSVAITVARHGFGGLLKRSPLGRVLFKDKALPESDEALRQAPAAVRFRKLLEALGPTYIKLGQILSMRPDILPQEYVDALSDLQDNTPVLPFEQMRAVVEDGLGAPLEELFADFEQTPLGTASIAQTYLATTHDGERVVVKVQRPGIERTMRGDLDLLYLGAKILEATIDEMDIYGPSEVVVEFERALVKELDFNTELNSLLRARRFLDPERAVVVPRPYPELSSKTVLVMEYFEGVPLRKLEPGSARAKHAVEEILHAASKQIALDGFFHGDPHPGNILINDDDVLCMIDLGMMGSLSESQREDIVTLVLAGIVNDTQTLARTLIRIGNPTQRINMSEFKAEIDRIRSQHLVVDHFGDYNSAAFIQEFVGAANRYRIKLNTEYSVLMKATATLEGIIRDLYPEVDMVGIAKPYAEQVMRRRYTPDKLLQEAMGGVTGVGSLIRHLPGQLDQVLHDVETGNLQVKAITPRLDALTPMLHQVGSRLTLALFASAMSLCAAVLLPNDPTTVYNVPLLSVFCIVMAVAAWTILWWWHFVGKGKRLRIQPWIDFFNRS